MNCMYLINLALQLRDFFTVRNELMFNIQA